MLNRILLLILINFLVACSNAQSAYAKTSAPVAIEYIVPKTVEVGEQVVTKIKFVSKTNIQRMEVYADSYNGLELISGGDRTGYTELQNGDSREIEVNIRLLDEVGYLSVFATTTDSSGKVQSKSIMIRYGIAGEITKQKLKSKNVMENSNGEKLILMQGDERN